VCTQCTKVGGLDGAGNPKGVIMLSRNLTPHLAHVRAEEAEDALQQREDREEVEAHLFALTLTDNGPDYIGQPSKLWSSCAEFQQDVHQTHHLTDHSASPPVGDILEGLTWLSVSQDSPLSSCIDPTSVSAPTPGPSARFSSQEHLQKKERSNCMTEALKVLDQIEKQIGACQPKPVGTPTCDSLREAKSTLNLLHPAMEKVTHKTPLIDACKVKISEQLVGLEARIAELNCNLLCSQENVFYISGE
jgi:hypothetical protein